MIYREKVLSLKINGYFCGTKDTDMKKRFRLKARRMARESIYGEARYVLFWNGYFVFEPVFTDLKEHCVGIPEFILIKDGEARWTNDCDESFAIMKLLRK